MLQLLSIRNFAIIRAIDIQFRDGIHVFTGESGAGKSILMQALNVALGARASTEYIRSGADAFFLTVVFNVAGIKGIKELLQKHNLEADEITDEIIISRKLEQGGKGQILINGMISTLRALTDIASLLVSVHGQYDNWKLLDSHNHLCLVDSFILEDDTLLGDYQAHFDAWAKRKKELESMKKKMAENAKQIEKFCFQFQEISEANLIVGEDEEIHLRLKKMQHAEEVIASAECILHKLQKRDGIQSIISELHKAAYRIVKIDPTMAFIEETISSILIQTEELAKDLSDYVYHLDFSPNEMQMVQERDNLFYKLQKKYGKTISELIQYKEHLENEIASFQLKFDQERFLEKEIEELETILYKKQEYLNLYRKEQTIVFCKKLESLLHDLMMPHAKVEFHLVANELTRNGVTSAELLFSANYGEPLKRLNQIASGGEVSRFALAIKTLLAKKLQIPTIILDEIDVGISGNAAICVAKMIEELGKYTQVLCITHLPQTAAVADYHYKLEKRIAEGRTETGAVLLDNKTHVEELARILEGDNYSRETIATAQGFIQQIKEK